MEGEGSKEREVRKRGNRFSYLFLAIMQTGIYPIHNKMITSCQILVTSLKQILITVQKFKQKTKSYCLFYQWKLIFPTCNFLKILGKSQIKPLRTYGVFFI